MIIVPEGLIMPVCPNCGAWVNEGESICSCGASIGGSNSDIYFESDIISMSDRAERLRQNYEFNEAINLNEDIIKRIDQQGETNYLDSFSSHHRRNALKEIEEIKQILYNLQNLNPVLGKLSDEVFRELNTGFDENIFTILNKLEYTVKQYEKYQNCKLIELTVNSELINNPDNQVVARFHKKGKYANILLELKYFGGTSFGFVGIGKKIYDDRLLIFPEFVRLIGDITNKGFEYKGINSIYVDSINIISEIGSYFIDTYDWVVLTFERDGFYQKNYKFDMKSRTYESMDDRYDLSKLLDENNHSAEKEFLLNEIRNIEDRYHCRFEECGESKLVFNINNKEKLICNYDLETHKMSKHVQCSNIDFEDDYGVRYGFVPADYF